MNIDMEHICLSSEEEEQEHTGPAERIAERRFDQSSRLHRCEAHFEVFNTHHVEVKTRGLSNKARHYELDLSFLDPAPRRVRSIDWPLAWASGVLAGAAVVTATLVPPLASATIHVMIVAALLAGAFVSLGLLVQRFRDRIVFCSRHGRWPLLALLNHEPTPGQLQDFIDELSARIRQTRDNWPDRQQFLSAELREHRRLRDEGILSPETYDAIKRRILSKHTQPGVKSS